MNKIFKLLFICFILNSCSGDFLEIKPNKKIAIPETLKDMAALMDNVVVMNQGSVLSMGEIGSDDYYLEERDWNLLSEPYQKNGYIWNADIFEGQSSNGWDLTYHRILYSNIVLEGLQKISNTDESNSEWSRVKGTALFWRAWQFFQLAQIFCDNYEVEDAAEKPGIPLRISSDINQSNSRASIEATYQQIVNDLNVALELLPDLAEVKTRPSKHAIYALLSRVYLQMKKYDLAREHANNCLRISGSIIDYNTLKTDLRFSFPINSIENIEQPLFDAMIITQLFFSNFKLDTALLSSYHSNDLRAKLYFTESNGYTIFKGSYNGYNSFNAFPAVDEVILIRAECNARLNDFQEALSDLNKLLVKRYMKNTYEPLTLENTDDVFNKVLIERRKSLVFRGVRWSDLRRTRNEKKFEIVREINDKSFVLTSDNEKLLTWPIPDNVVILGSISQNER